MDLQFLISGKNLEKHFLRSYQERISSALPQLLDGKYFVNIAIINDAEMRVVNKTYRHLDQPTDVITFAFNERSEKEQIILPSKKPRLLADIYIDRQQIARQMKATYHDELLLMLIHSLLHALGYDHKDDESEKQMNEIQNDIFTKLTKEVENEH
jgi:probable rRNA maturation factor